jgi:hypothetical protein
LRSFSASIHKIVKHFLLLCYFIHLKHSEKFPVFGGHLIAMHIPPRKDERYYAYSSRVRVNLHTKSLRVGANVHTEDSFPLLRIRHKNTPFPMPLEVFFFYFSILKVWQIYTQKLFPNSFVATKKKNY